ncbi:MAG: hypothetical protein A3E31_10585 [Candidatus Rokubacteria bacterium RIFCSPHIGHO2_12_FULL_73_22]|uniref:Uncharacterized protein n=1 Tax=uncultured bacterium Rifle_16ft_4_minimus_37862 TaxID=1665157 RepID=A0A0H4T982_9BACT|nr:hypothetical protein [uncultured bacterium Rifle_16ft_4_minimus_37862]OGL01896.1 MAG: hypothetical protein A3D33_02185 [Candidatus Rokubacteria bacterium RIFCSPHIGHO2_02_FULL_73_26]OGL02918.1 MAG: hypothetical protein A3E31_10585 [Candidatus Rokubacteria bacterium RIFCSPHIGHO2_12_FULL_73_22]OGL07728.1 MAG: hypothetical protein A3I14_08740 [Candidatus Rokubacteria bacterium RIFCSPLOWO2_02_FULL_73_56]OGL20871.1 MAG: hypothetical protein A3G44_16550 [Candidatus Rokubacteria bacterium RIFCSPLOWO
MLRLVVAAALTLALAGGCQPSQPPAPAASAPTKGPLTAQLKAEGDALMARGDFEKAVVKYLAAVNQEPKDVSLRFALGVALSNLDRRDETIEQFRFVASNGAAGSDEVRLARDWLAKAGALDGSVPEPRQASKPEPATASGPPRGKLLGKLTWGGIDPRDHLVRVTVAISGEDDTNRDVHLQGTNFKLGWGYDFKNVPPGSYRITAESAGTRMWELKVSVAPGKDTVLDLTEANSLVTPKDFTPQDG